jgi:peptide/nickel transport system permease protein
MAVIASESVVRTKARQTTALDVLKKIARSYLFRRVLRAIFTIYLVTTLLFFLLRLLPGDPIQVFINQQITQFGMSYDQAKSMAQSLFVIDSSQPLYEQYFHYMQNLLQGNLGMSVTSQGATVTSIIESRIWWTVFAVGSGLLIAFSLGVGLGMLMAYKRNTLIDTVLTAFASVTNSAPNYLVALMIIVIFGVWEPWIPFVNMRGSISSGQHVEFSWAFIEDVLWHAMLPIAVYVLTSVGGWMLTMKGSTVAALEEDFVTAARARGVPEWRIAIFYVGRNAILPLFTSLTISIGFVVAGSLLVEPIFQYQGIGAMLFQSLQKRDYTVMQGIFLVITIAVVVANLIADMLYSRLDPRIRKG